MGNFSDKDVLVAIGDDTYHVEAKDCPYAFRDSQKESVSIKIGFKTTQPTASDEKEFSLEQDLVIWICEYEGKARFCKIEKLEPTSLRLIS